jgi:hypothetical protein
MGFEYLMFKTGPLTMPPSQLGAFAKSGRVAAHAEHGVARAAALARQVRRSAASRSLRSRRRCATCGRPRAGTCASSPRSAGGAGDPAQLPFDPRRSRVRGEGHALHAQDHGGAGAREVLAGGMADRDPRSNRTRRW